ncbi:MAG TPA: hypothetical protein VFD73_12565 [Gemmatimonadales bacterium]|nr:hypothetical protein [Gemmatimonadales bacterium]
MIVADIGEYRINKGVGYLLFTPVGQPNYWLACAALAVREVIGPTPPPPPAEPATAATPPSTPPPATPTVAPTPPAPLPPLPGETATAPAPDPAPPARTATHERLRQANAGGRRAGVDHGANAATEADFVQGVTEERAPKPPPAAR